jgi:hypothetical protein
MSALNPPEQLGARLDTFAVRLVPRGVSLSAGLLALVLAAVALVSLIGSRAVSPWPVLRLGGMGLFFLAAGLFLLRRALSGPSGQVVVYERGLVRYREERAIPLCWEHVVSLRRLSRPVRVEVQDDQGWCFTFDDSLARFEQLGRLIEERTLEPLLERARCHWQRGELVEFGPLGVSQEGIGHGEDRLDWDRCAGLEEAGGLVAVLARDQQRPFARVERERIDNLHVLFRLVEWVQSGSGQAESVTRDRGEV